MIAQILVAAWAFGALGLVIALAVGASGWAEHAAGVMCALLWPLVALLVGVMLIGDAVHAARMRRLAK